MIALIRELLDDRTGDPDKKFDVIWRILFIVCEGLILSWIPGKSFVESLLLSSAIFFFGFDYLVHWIMIRNKVIELPKGETWFSYVGKSSAFDRWKPWVKLGKWGRFAVKFVFLTLAIINFV
jgi:hypothetical protein